MSGGGGSTSTTTTQKLSPEAKQLLGLAMPVITQYGQEAQTGTLPIYPGTQTAAINPYQTLGANMAAGLAQGDVGAASTQALQGLNFFTSGDVLNRANNPALGASIDAAIRPITENFTENVLSNLRDESIMAGDLSHSRGALGETLAARDYLRQVADTSAQMESAAYQQGLDAMLRSMGFAPGVINAGYSPATALAGAGDYLQQLQQGQISGAAQQFYSEQYLPFLMAQQIANMAFGVPAGTNVSVGSGGGTSPLMGGLGGAASGAAMGTMVMPGWGTAAGALIGGLMGAFG